MSGLLLKDFIILDNDSTTVTDILIEEDKIVKVEKDINIDNVEIINGEGKLFLSPGLFDMHVHLRDPGFTHKEDIITGTSAALAGGFTGVACMPNTKPATDSKEIVEYIINKAKDTGVEVYPVGCVTRAMNGESLCDFDELKSAGAIAVSDDGRPVENAEFLRQAIKLCDEKGLLVISHCEDMNIIGKGIIHRGEISEKLGVVGMDRASEDSITAREIALAMSVDGRIHIAHVSTKGAIDFIRDAKKRGVKVTAETCPHYFTYTHEKLLSRDADYRMNPPLREESDRVAVLEAVLDGTIDCIVTDHAPHTSEEKADFLKAPNGVVGLETSLAVTLTKLYQSGKITLNKLVDLMSVKPRKILNLPIIKVEEGSNADLCIIDLEKEWTVVPEKLHSKSNNTVFKGEKLKGKVLFTISKGKVRYNFNIEG